MRGVCGVVSDWCVDEQGDHVTVGAAGADACGGQRVPVLRCGVCADVSREGRSDRLGGGSGESGESWTAVRERTVWVGLCTASAAIDAAVDSAEQWTVCGGQ